VINGGPWIIYDHILAVSQWFPTFNASTATIDKTMVWIRIPSLNLVYYDESLLWALASMIGTPVKVDLHTLKVARGKFARMCVEIDLTKPVVGRVGINGDWYHVQYEGLHIICTQCGCYGHVLKDCGIKRNNATMEKQKMSGEDGGGGGATASTGEKPTVVKPNVNQGGINDEIPSNLIESVGEITPDLLHGEWIKVERKNRNKKGNANGFNGRAGSGNGQHSQNTILNMVERLNRQYPPHKGHVNDNGISSSKNKMWFKKKRPRNDGVGPSKSVPIDTQLIHNPESHEVIKGGYAATQSKMGGGKAQVQQYKSKENRVPSEKESIMLEKQEIMVSTHKHEQHTAILHHDNSTRTSHHEREVECMVNVESQTKQMGDGSMDVTQKVGDNIMGLKDDTNMLIN
jgi:hypothetical protein